jgi:hypothetical protein
LGEVEGVSEEEGLLGPRINSAQTLLGPILEKEKYRMELSDWLKTVEGEHRHRLVNYFI